MKTKKVDEHTEKCEVCNEMAKRGYRDEEKYWDDFFDHKLKPVKYKLIK